MTSPNLPEVTIATNGRERVEPPPNSVAELYRQALPALDFLTEQTKKDVALIVRGGDVHNVLATGMTHPDLSMTFLRNLTAVDWEEAGIEVVYHLFSLRHHQGVVVKAMLPAADPSIASVSDLFASAEWAEREAREMFGIEFPGLRDSRNLLLDEDIDIHPLLKSHPLAEIEIPQGVDIDQFTKQYPPPTREEDEAAKEAAAAAEAAQPKPEKKSVEDMTPEEVAERKAAQGERVTRARELAAARRAEGPATTMRERDPDAELPAAPEPAATPSSEAEEAAPASSAAPPTRSSVPVGDGEGELTDEQKAERVKRGRELAAARRAELRKERGE